MRMFLGIIVGIILTIGFAWISDSMAPAPVAAGTGEPAVETRMVNWEVVRSKLNNFGSDVREGWNRLTGPSKPASP